MMSTIQFKTKLFNIGTWILLKLPKEASDELPSRGMVMVEGCLNDRPFLAPLEPDGQGSHWLKVDQPDAQAGDTVIVSLTPVKVWPEPNAPEDLQRALASRPSAQALWMEITTPARWDWIRWINATGNPVTRQRRIEIALSKLDKGDRRPCCFNRSLCTEPALSKNGVLLV
jgi:Bacteriocin-protection, YdeI or OmpD-Associated/Domain of unknown function (DUF1905)